MNPFDRAGTDGGGPDGPHWCVELVGVLMIGFVLWLLVAALR